MFASDFNTPAQKPVGNVMVDSSSFHQVHITVPLRQTRKCCWKCCDLTNSLCTSAERGSILSVVLDLSVLPHQQTSQLLHLPLQQAAHRQQGAHQLNAHLKKHTKQSDSPAATIRV